MNPAEYAKAQFSILSTKEMIRILRDQPSKIPPGFIAAVADRLEDLQDPLNG